MKLPYLKHLNNRGLSHLLLPLVIVLGVAVVGTYMLVASHAQTAAVRHSSTKKSHKDSGPTGVMLLYNNGGLYKKVAIVTYNPQNHPHCGTKKFIGYNVVTANLATQSPTRLICSAGNYDVYFLKKGQRASATDVRNISSFAAAAVQTNYCSFVHITGVSRVEALDSDGHCKGDNDPSELNIVKATPTLKLTQKPDPEVIGKAYSGTIELKLDTKNALSPEECAGSIELHATQSGPLAAGGYKKINIEHPLRFSPKTKSCVYTYHEGAKESKNKVPGTAKGTITFTGNKFLNPVTIDYTDTIVKD